MRAIGYAALTAALLACPLVNAETAAGEEDVGNLLSGGKAKLNLRYRYENVDDDAFAEEAKAGTLRTRLTLESGKFHDFSGAIEFDNISEVVNDDFNAGEGNTPGRTMYPVVADPEGTEINQLYADYTGFESTRLRVGRQRITLDNHRFVGNVGWRQNEQTYDALSGSWDRDNVHLFYAYVDDVKRIFGEDVPAGHHNQDNTHLLNGRIDVAGLGSVTGYYYHIDNEDSPGFSTGTFGARLVGQQDIDSFGVRYALEFARQKEVSDNPVSYDANYYLIDAGVVLANFDFGLGWEVLGGDDDVAGKAFRTPLATLHAFNGWADKFLATPNAGLDDKYAKAKATFGSFSAEAIYHDFGAEDSGDDFGDEWDLVVGYQFHPRLRADLKLADFDGDSGSSYSDTTKFWVMVTASLP